MRAARTNIITHDPPHRADHETSRLGAQALRLRHLQPAYRAYDRGVIRVADALRRLIDIGLRHGGSYFPTYHRYALRRQVDACYPQFEEFHQAQRKYDPEELYQSEWYRHYKRMFFPPK